MKLFILATMLLTAFSTQANVDPNVRLDPLPSEVTQEEAACAKVILKMASDELLAAYPDTNTEPEIEAPRFVHWGANEYAFFTAGSLYLPGPYDGYAQMSFDGKVRINADRSCTVTEWSTIEYDIAD